MSILVKRFSLRFSIDVRLSKNMKNGKESTVWCGYSNLKNGMAVDGEWTLFAAVEGVFDSPKIYFDLENGRLDLPFISVLCRDSGVEGLPTLEELKRRQQT
jgi:hypothetical protein